MKASEGTILQGGELFEIAGSRYYKIVDRLFIDLVGDNEIRGLNIQLMQLVIERDNHRVTVISVLEQA